MVRFQLKQKYLSDLLASGEITPVMIEINKQDSGIRNTEMNDLIGAFRMLLALCIASLTIFVMEIRHKTLKTLCRGKFNANVVTKLEIT